MRFNISLTSEHLEDNDDKKALESIGYKFERETNEHYLRFGYNWVLVGSDTMVVELSSLEELCDFVKTCNNPIIVDSRCGIEIYNGYRE